MIDFNFLSYNTQKVCKPKFLLKRIVSKDSLLSLLLSSNIFPWATVSHPKVVL